MPVTGLYMARRVRYSIIPYVAAYGQWVLKDVVPTFANLSERADAIVTSEFNRHGEQPAGADCDDVMSVLAEAAQDKGQNFYNTMLAIHQSSLNLFSVGLFHLLEQQLAHLCRDGVLDMSERLPPSDTKLDKIEKWYCNRNNFNIDLSKLSDWPKIDQLRLLANSIKHGEGKSAVELRNIRPDIFQNPNLCMPMQDLLKVCTTILHERRPMAGEDIFVTNEIFAEFSQAVNSFVAEIAEYFDAHQDEHYLVGRVA